MPRRLKLNRSRNLQQLIFGVLFIITIVFITLKLSSRKPFQPSIRLSEPRSNLFLESQQCLAAFPENNKEIENAVKKGTVKLQRLPDNTKGLVQGRIKKGKV